MRKKQAVIGIISLTVASALLLVGLYFARSVYRRVETRLILARDTVQTEGVLTEKTISETRDLIFPITVYTARYTYPNAQGVIRNGQQDLTADEYIRLPEAGKPITVYFLSADAAQNAIARSPSFPGSAGWRATAACVLLIGSAFSLGFGLNYLKRIRS